MQFNPRNSEEEDDKIMKRLVSILFVALVVSLAVVSYAWAQESKVNVTATVAPDINDQIGLGFSTDWDSSKGPEGQTGWSATSDANNPWNMGTIAPASDAFTAGNTTTTSVERYFWIYKYQSNTWSGVETEVTGSVLTLKDFARFYPWTGSDISSEPIPGPLTGTLESKPIHPSFASTWSWPTKLVVNLENQWQIPAGEYQGEITNKWFYCKDSSGTEDTTRAYDDCGPIDRYFKLTVDKALDSKVGLVFGTSWQGGQIGGQNTSFTIEDNQWSDGITAEFYGGLSDFRSNTVTYNRITIGPMKQAGGVDQATDLRNYIYQYFWTGGNFTEQGQKIYPQDGGDYVVTSTLQHQSGLCTVPNKFEVNIPKDDVFKVGAGTYTATVTSEWSFEEDFDPTIANAKAGKTVSVTVPEVYDGYTLPESGTFGDAVKPTKTATYTLAIEGYQNHDRQVTVSTTVGEGLKSESFNLSMGGNPSHASGSVSGLSWTGTFEFNSAGEKSVLPLTWTFTPDWTYAPDQYTMTITLTHVPTM